mgnify:FL=1
MFLFVVLTFWEDSWKLEASFANFLCWYRDWTCNLPKLALPSSFIYIIKVGPLWYNILHYLVQFIWPLTLNKCTHFPPHVFYENILCHNSSSQAINPKPSHIACTHVYDDNNILAMKHITESNTSEFGVYIVDCCKLQDFSNDQMICHRWSSLKS